MKVRAHTCYLGKTGYAAHARAFFRELSKHVELRVRNCTWDDDPDYLNSTDYSILDKISLRVPGGEMADFPIAHSFPRKPWVGGDFDPDIDIVLVDTDHYYFYQDYSAPLKIAYTVWESTLLPEGFFQQLLKFDALWVVTQWHRDRAIEQGYPAERVFVVNEGAESDLCPCIPPQVVSEYDDERFKFLFFGRWDYRKAVPEILRAFLEEFSPDEEVDFVLSADNPYAVDGLSSTEERLAHYGLEDPRIKVKHFMDREEYVSYLKTGNVMVTCARSEGWNIPLMEAIAAGTPAIYTAWGAQKEFAEGRGLPVAVLGEVPANIGAEAGLAHGCPGNYAEPDFEDLKRVMRDAYERYPDHKRKALRECTIFRSKFSWAAAAKAAVDSIESLQQALRAATEPATEAAIVMTHADSPQKIEILKECVFELKKQGYYVILSSHIVVPDEIAKMADYLIVDFDNPVIPYEDRHLFNVDWPHFWRKNAIYELSYPCSLNHGYAALLLIKNGIEAAAQKGFDKFHAVNYDYVLRNPQTLSTHSFFVDSEEPTVVTYKWGGNESSINSGLFSGKSISVLNSLSSITDAYTYFEIGADVILEICMHRILKNAGIKVHHLDIEFAKDGNLLDTVMLDQFTGKIEKNVVTSSGLRIGEEFLLLKDTEGLYYLTVNSSVDEIEFEITAGGRSFPKKIQANSTRFIQIPYDTANHGFTVRLRSGEINIPPCSKRAGSLVIKDHSLIEKLEEIVVPEPRISYSFVGGPFVEILSNWSSSYAVSFRDKATNSIIYQTVLNNNQWARCSRKYHTDCEIKITDLNSGKQYVHEFNAEGKRVLFSLGSKSLGDTVAWFPHIEEYAKTHSCKAVVSTFKNDMFRSVYPEIEFIEPGQTANDLYASYEIGWFYKDDRFDPERHPQDFRPLPMQQTTTDILGLPHTTKRPKIALPANRNRPIQEKYVCLGIHSTAQAKYWNNPSGWQEVTDHFKKLGYRVIVLSTEPDGYMGNPHPAGSEIIEGPRTIESTINYLLHAELFIGVGSGLSWLSWAVCAPTVIISGFSLPHTEPLDSHILRIFNESTCNGCFNRKRLDAGDWNWCPDHKDSPRQFECSKLITGSKVIESIEERFYKPRIAFITAIRGGYESTCKPFAKQSIPADFICFTDEPNIKDNGWSIDTHPYHDTHPSELDDALLKNSLKNNRHTFNIAKYYKQAWQNIPRLKDYDVVVWLDGTVEITNPHAAKIVYEKTLEHKIVGWNHEWRHGILEEEAKGSVFNKYHSTHWFGQDQPFQDVMEQYQEYVKDGYDESFWSRIEREEGRGLGPHFGVWVTCFVAFNNKSPEVTDFLNLWYMQTLKYTTQDQVGFPKAVQDSLLIPYTFPDEQVKGEKPHEMTDLYTKLNHGL